jgi:GTPase SAR1 family protein
MKKFVWSLPKSGNYQDRENTMQQVPKELLELIFSFLPTYSSLLQVTNVNKEWRRIFLDSHCENEEIQTLFETNNKWKPMLRRRVFNYLKQQSPNDTVLQYDKTREDYLKQLFPLEKKQTIPETSFSFNAIWNRITGMFSKYTPPSPLTKQEEQVSQIDKDQIKVHKCILVGDDYVGRSSLISSVSEQINSLSCNIIALDFISIGSQISESCQQRMNIFDETHRYYKFKANNFSLSYYRFSSFALLCFNITNEVSFNNISDKWIDNVKLYNENTELILVGLQCDQESKRKVSMESAERLALQLQIPYIEVSCVTSSNVILPFLYYFCLHYCLPEIKIEKKQIVDPPK